VALIVMLVTVNWSLCGIRHNLEATWSYL